MRKIIFKFNKFPYLLSLRGLGILNYKNGNVTGEKYFLKRFLKGLKEPFVLDMGSNVGDYSRKVMDICERANIHSFEPYPRTYEKLSESAGKYGFSAYNIACSDVNTKLQL